jgi:hypothetical protein
MKVPKALLAPLRLHVFSYMATHPPTRIINNLAGGPYLNRWELLGNCPAFDIYLHQFLTSDDSRALHDHTAASIAIVLSGNYTEWFKENKQSIRTEGDIILRRATTAHRIEINEGRPGPITVFLRGPKLREWGFYCITGWRHHTEFGERGCDP